MQVGRTSPARTVDMVGDEQGSTNPSLLAAPHAASMPLRAPSSLEHGKPCGLLPSVPRGSAWSRARSGAAQIRRRSLWPFSLPPKRIKIKELIARCCDRRLKRTRSWSNTSPRCHGQSCSPCLQ